MALYNFIKNSYLLTPQYRYWELYEDAGDLFFLPLALRASCLNYHCFIGKVKLSGAKDQEGQEAIYFEMLQGYMSF